MTAGTAGAMETATDGDDRTRVLLGKLTLTRDEVSYLLSVPVSTVEGQHESGNLCGRKIGKRLVWLPSDVQRFVARLGNDG